MGDSYISGEGAYGYLAGHRRPRRRQQPLPPLAELVGGAARGTLARRRRCTTRSSRSPARGRLRSRSWPAAARSTEQLRGRAARRRPHPAARQARAADDWDDDRPRVHVDRRQRRRVLGRDHDLHRARLRRRHAAAAGLRRRHERVARPHARASCRRSARTSARRRAPRALQGAAAPRSTRSTTWTRSARSRDTCPSLSPSIAASDFMPRHRAVRRAAGHAGSAALIDLIAIRQTSCSLTLPEREWVVDELPAAAQPEHRLAAGAQPRRRPPARRGRRLRRATRSARHDPYVNGFALGDDKLGHHRQRVLPPERRRPPRALRPAPRRKWGDNARRSSRTTAPAPAQARRRRRGRHAGRDHRRAAGPGRGRDRARRRPAPAR